MIKKYDFFLIFSIFPLEKCVKVYYNIHRTTNQERKNMENQDQQEKRVTVVMSVQLYDQIERLAEKSGVKNISAIIRQGMTFYLTQNALLLNFDTKENEKKTES